MDEDQQEQPEKRSRSEQDERVPMEITSKRKADEDHWE